MWQRITQLTFIGLLLAYSVVVPAGAQPSPPQPQDAQYYSQTGFRVDDQAASFFQSHGGIDTFGYPVSRLFNFLGCSVQMFQRLIIQLCAGQGPALINLLDPEIFPYTRVNGSVFPPADDGMKAATPRVDDPSYATAIGRFIQDNTPNTVGSHQVGFFQTFQARGGLDVLGAPISHPLADPSNASFIYMRFQRIILHYRAGIGTEPLLLSDYLKAVITANSSVHVNLPDDLAAQAQSSKYFAQYCPGADRWLCRPNDLPGTDLTFAFESALDSASTGPTVPRTASATTTPQPPTATRVPTITSAPAPAATGDIDGTVKDDNGAPPPDGTYVRTLDPARFLASVDSSTGKFSLAGIPTGDYSFYAWNEITHQTGSSVFKNITAGATNVLSLDLLHFPGGGPTVIGGSVYAGGKPVKGALVWRIGGAGSTSTDANGNFVLIDAMSDAFGKGGPARIPEAVIMVAAKDAQWGFISWGPSERDPARRNTPKPLRLSLDRRGPTPPQPRAYDLIAQARDFTSHTFNPSEAAFVTARWKTSPNPAVSLRVTYLDGRTPPELVFATSRGNSAGDCGCGDEYEIYTLPANHGGFKLQPWNDLEQGDPSRGSAIADPKWDEAQVVAFPRR